MKVGFTASAFDLGPHAGHVMMLKEAKQHCDYLIAALHVNPSMENTAKNEPVLTVPERYLQLKACRYVDEIIPYETEYDLMQLIYLLQPDIRFIGEDYLYKFFTGKDATLSQGKPLSIHYCSRQHSLSSTEIRKRIMLLGKNK